MIVAPIFSFIFLIVIYREIIYTIYFYYYKKKIICTRFQNMYLCYNVKYNRIIPTKKKKRKTLVQYDLKREIMRFL